MGAAALLGMLRHLIQHRPRFKVLLSGSHTLDELQAVCASKPPKILLSPAVCEDIDIDGRLQWQATEVKDYAMLEQFAGPYRDLLERQLRLILKRLTDPTPR